MYMPHLKLTLPQISRFFPAPTFRRVLTISGKLILWGILAFIVSVNAELVHPQGKFLFLNSVRLDRFVASVTSKSQQILGAQNQTSPTPKEKNNLEEEYQYWLAIVSDHPDYRDGFYRLAVVAYQLGYVSEAREYLERTRSLDPNFPRIMTLEQLLEGNE